MKPNVHCVWLAKGGRKEVKIMRFQLNIHLIKHGIDLTSIELDSVSIFQKQARQNTKKKKKNGCDFEAVNTSCMVCIKRNVTKFSSLQTKTNSFTKKDK